MRVGILKLVGIAIMLAGIDWQLMAGDFAPPAEGPVPFRRDKVPLDADAITALSRHVENLARGLNAETPADRRGAAQMLALALALDPDNARIRNLVESYQQGKHRPDADAERLERSRARIWQSIAWLESPDAGADGRLLAACLQDVMVVSDPKHPKSATLKQAGEKGTWAAWIPPLSSYEEPKAVVSEDPPDKKDEDGKPEIPAVAGQTPSLPLEKSTLQTILWLKVGKDDAVQWVLGPASLEMAASFHPPEPEGQPAKEFAVHVGPGGDPDPLGQTSKRITRLMKALYDKIPTGMLIHINSKQLEQAIESKKRQSISGACAVLASAAITGREPDAIVIGQVEEDGSFKLPTALWSQLRALGKGTGKRLILPTDAGAVLPSLLALENPGFFMEYEVMLANDFKHVLELCSKKPADALATPMARFAEIRDRMGSQDIRLYLGNTFVKQRLMTVIQEAPFHFSAKALLIQASGNRPTLLVRPVLAAELLHALEPMMWLADINDQAVTAAMTARINDLYDASKARVDGFARYAEKNDQVLLDKARETVDGLRAVERATRTRGESWAVQGVISAAVKDLGRRYHSFTAAVAEATGEGPQRRDN